MILAAATNSLRSAQVATSDAMIPHDCQENVAAAISTTRRMT